MPPALAVAAQLRSIGLNPIPCSPRLGHPPFAYSDFRDNGMPARRFAYWVDRGVDGIQVATGVRWNLAVIDLDGDLARGVWSAWTRFRPHPPTPTVATPSGGLHLWFSIPNTVSALPSRCLWDCPGEAHTMVELLADGKLARCPPSVKVVDGVARPYTWLPGRSPSDVPMAPLPAWAIELPPAGPAASQGGIGLLGGATLAAPRAARAGGGASYKDVLAAIPDKVGLARRWGLRVVSDVANANGWITCRKIGCEDRNPSARFSVVTGRYWEPALGRMPVDLIDVAIMLGVYPDFKSAIRDLETTYGTGRAS